MRKRKCPSDGRVPHPQDQEVHQVNLITDLWQGNENVPRQERINWPSISGCTWKGDPGHDEAPRCPVKGRIRGRRDAWPLVSPVPVDGGQQNDESGNYWQCPGHDVDDWINFKCSTFKAWKYVSETDADKIWAKMDICWKVHLRGFDVHITFWWRVVYNCRWQVVDVRIDTISNDRG